MNEGMLLWKCTVLLQSICFLLWTCFQPNKSETLHLGLSKDGRARLEDALLLIWKTFLLSLISVFRGVIKFTEFLQKPGNCLLVSKTYHRKFWIAPFVCCLLLAKSSSIFCAFNGNAFVLMLHTNTRSFSFHCVFLANKNKETTSFLLFFFFC